MTPTTELREVADTLIARAEAEHILLRVCGGLGCWYHSEGGRHLGELSDRQYQDVDFAAYYVDRERIGRLLNGLGFREDFASATVPGIRRTMFVGNELKGDVFYDKLTFSHTIDLDGRLELDRPTIPVADLLLQKLQIADFTGKDMIDVQMLMLSHELGANDNDRINTLRISRLCGDDWGLCHTFLRNLDACRNETQHSPLLQPVDRDTIIARLSGLERTVVDAPKSVRWRMRSLIGERMRWYEIVDDA